MVRLRAVALASTLVFVAGCAATTGSNGSKQKASLPSDVSIKEPSPKASDWKRDLSGKWEGYWGTSPNGLHSFFVVEKVSSNGAQVVYAWGTLPSAGVNEPGHDRAQARFVGKKLIAEYDGGARTVFEPGRESDTLQAEWFGPNGGNAEGTFHRVKE